MKKCNFVFGLLVAGCASTHQVQLTTKTIPVDVPILYCPAPPTIDPPTSVWTVNPSDGELVKEYVATVDQLIGYNQQLQRIVEQYKTINESYKAQAEKTKGEWK